MAQPCLIAALTLAAALAGTAGSAAALDPRRGPAVSPPTFLAKVAVFGRDDRTPLPATHRTLRQQIGLIYEPRSRSICTAFCVSNDIVATAGHCLFRTIGEKPLSLAGMWFRLGKKNTRSHTRLAGAASGGASQHVMSGSTRLNVRPPIDATRDWALVRLARPVCTGGGLALSQRNAAEVGILLEQKRVFQVAFHRDFRNWELAWSPCTPPDLGSVDRQSLGRDFTGAEHLLLHGCDSGGASSGSPLLIAGASGYEVVGINVGTYVQSKVLMQNDEVVRRFRPDEIANTGVSASYIAPRLRIFANAQIVGERDRIKEMQELLRRGGFLATAADGVFGPDLRAAIEAYERSRGLVPTGLPTEPLMRQLGGSPPKLTSKSP